MSNKPEKKKSIFSKIDYADYMRSLLWAIVIALIFRTFLYEPFKIPSGSMLPNLRVGDYLFTSKYPYGFSKYSFPLTVPFIEGRTMQQQPERGDIIVFKGPYDPSVFYIKRLIGFPGDIIQMKKGILHINDKPVKRENVGKHFRIGRFGEHIILDKYKETLPNGVEHTVLDANMNNHRHFPDSTKKYKVPEKHYFFMGDNRNNSIDSRYLNDIGYVPEENLVGRADFLFWSADFSFVDLVTKFETGRAFAKINNES